MGDFFIALGHVGVAFLVNIMSHCLLQVLNSDEDTAKTVAFLWGQIAAATIILIWSIFR